MLTSRVPHGSHGHAGGSRRADVVPRLGRGELHHGCRVHHRRRPRRELNQWLTEECAIAPEQSMKTLFVNGHIWDGNVDARFEGELLVAGARIEAVSRGHGELPRADATVDRCARMHIDAGARRGARAPALPVRHVLHADGRPAARGPADHDLAQCAADAGARLHGLHRRRLAAHPFRDHDSQRDQRGTATGPAPARLDTDTHRDGGLERHRTPAPDSQPMRLGGRRRGRDPQGCATGISRGRRRRETQRLGRRPGRPAAGQDHDVHRGRSRRRY